MDGKLFTIYRITAPNGCTYVGYTSQPPRERLRQHIANAKRKAGTEHPLYALIRSYGYTGFSIETLATVSTRDEALRAERDFIAKEPKEISMNLSSGGVADASEGGRIFWERINSSPELRAAYLKKLSDRKKNSDWTDYAALCAAAAKWRKEHPKDAYKISLRASRCAKQGKAPKVKQEDNMPRKEQLRRRFKQHDVRSDSMKGVWKDRDCNERDRIAQKIVHKARERFAGMSMDEKRAATEKARASIDRSKQGKAASIGIKAWWAKLRQDPVAYSEYITRRTQTAKEHRKHENL